MGHSLCAWCQVLGLGLYLPITGCTWGAEELTSSDLDQLVSRRPQFQIDVTGEQGAHTGNWGNLQIWGTCGMSADVC